MEKITLSAYTDKTFSQQSGKNLKVQINPKTFSLEKGIKYHMNTQAGDNSASGVFDKYDGEKLSFEIIIDCTGVIPDTGAKDTAYSKVSELEALVYDYKGDAHRPAFVQIVWGKLLFKGQLSSLKTEYMLFDKDGIPLRAKVAVAFANFIDEKTAKKKANKRSPDMSHFVVMREGDSLAALCQKIYGDSTLAPQVARINNLPGFRRVAAGTEILFPHLKKE